MGEFLAVVMFVGMAALGFFALRHPTAAQRTLRLPPHLLLGRTPEQMRDLVRFTGAGFVLVGVTGVFLTLLA